MNLQEYLYNEPTTNAVSVTKAPPVHKMMQPTQVNRWRQLKTIYKLPGSIGGFQLQAPPNQNIFLKKRGSDAKGRKSTDFNSILSGIACELPKVAG